MDVNTKILKNFNARVKTLFRVFSELFIRMYFVKNLAFWTSL